jgi:hypothetical protein
MRFVQYGAKTMVAQLGEKTDAGKKLKVFQSAVGLHRKAFKLGKFLDEAQKFIEALNNPKLADLERLLTLVQRAAMTIFVILDNLLWATEIKLVDAFDKATLKMKSYQFRLVAAVVSMAQVFLAMSKQQDSIEKLADSSSSDLEKAREKQGLNVWKAVKNVADVVTYSNSADMVEVLLGKALDDTSAGAVGTLSSFCGIMEIWLTKIK